MPRALPPPLPLPSIQALATSPVDAGHKVQIGTKLTRGLGAGGNPDVGMVGVHEGAGVFWDSGSRQHYTSERREGLRELDPPVGQQAVVGQAFLTG
jgi:hypothetical protein